jgi:hypothetical protein
MMGVGESNSNPEILLDTVLCMKIDCIYFIPDNGQHKNIKMHLKTDYWNANTGSYMHGPMIITNKCSKLEHFIKVSFGSKINLYILYIGVSPVLFTHKL